MTWNQVMALLAQGDSLTTRFIRRSDNLDPVAIAVTAMANTQGGTIVLGIDKVNCQLTGSTLPPDFLQWVSTVITPQVVVSLSEIQRQIHTVHVISVGIGEHQPHVYNGKIYRLDERTPSVFKPIEEEAPSRPSSPVISTLLSESGMLGVTLSQRDGELGRSSSLLSESPSPDPSPAFSTAFASSGESGKGFDHLPLQAPSLLVSPSFSKALDDMVGSSASDISPISHVPASPQPALNERQRQALAFMAGAQMIQNKKYRSLYSVSHKTAHLELTDMVNKGLIMTRGSGRSTHYILQETAS